MRVAPYLLSVLLLGAMPGSADAAPATIEGSWSGSGIAKLRNRTDRVVCRVSYTGWIFNEQFNERGAVQLSQRGSRLSVTVTSSRGSANLTLSRG